MLNLKLTKSSKHLLRIMPAVALAIIASGYFYFHSINKSEDPRVLPARNNFSKYDEMMRENQFSQALALLDEIEAVYLRTPGYQHSFELGVIENNRASVFLVQAETERLVQAKPPAELIENDLHRARKHLLSAIDIYNTWLTVHQSLDRHQIEQLISPYFEPHDPAFTGLRVEKIISKRVNDIAAAIEEMPRRLSVSHTNLGVIARYQNRPMDAQQHYETALTLWQRNKVARNNLNVLLGKPPENPSLLEKLFPPSKKSP